APTPASKAIIEATVVKATVVKAAVVETAIDKAAIDKSTADSAATNCSTAHNTSGADTSDPSAPALCEARLGRAKHNQCSSSHCFCEEKCRLEHGCTSSMRKARWTCCNG